MASSKGTDPSGGSSPSGGDHDGIGESRRWDRLHVWQIQAVRDLLVISAVIALVYLGYAMRAVTTPLLIALALAYLFEPFVAFATERGRVRRPFVVGGLLAVLVTVAGATLILTVPLAVRQTFSLVDDVRSGRLVRAVVNAEEGLPEPLREPFRGFLEISGLLEVKERAVAAAKERADAAAERGDAAGESASAALGADGGGTNRDADETRGDDPSLVTTIVEGIGDDAEGNEPEGRRRADDRLPTDDDADAEERIRLADLDRDVDTPIFPRLFDIEPEDDRVRRIVREEIAASSLVAPTAATGPNRWMNVVHRGVSTAWSILGATIAISLLLFLIPFYFFFFSLWWPTVTGFLGGLIPQRHRPRSLELLGQMDRAVAGFVRGRVVISAIVAVILGVGWYSIGVPYSIVLALVVGVFNLVPYLCGIGLPIAIGLLAMDQLGVPPESRQTWLWIALAPTVVFVVAQFLDGYVLTPLIAGKATDLDPVTIVVAIIAGGTIAGIYGMLIAIPAAACVKILLREVLLPKVKAWTRGEAADPLPLQE